MSCNTKYGDICAEAFSFRGALSRVPWALTPSCRGLVLVPDLYLGFHPGPNGGASSQTYAPRAKKKQKSAALLLN